MLRRRAPAVTGHDALGGLWIRRQHQHGVRGFRDGFVHPKENVQPVLASDLRAVRDEVRPVPVVLDAAVGDRGRVRDALQPQREVVPAAEPLLPRLVARLQAHHGLLPGNRTGHARAEHLAQLRLRCGLHPGVVVPLAPELATVPENAHAEAVPAPLPPLALVAVPVRKELGALAVVLVGQPLTVVPASEQSRKGKRGGSSKRRQPHSAAGGEVRKETSPAAQRERSFSARMSGLVNTADRWS